MDMHFVYSLASALKRLVYLGRQVPSALTPAELPRRGRTLIVSNVGTVQLGLERARCPCWYLAAAS
ncbi:hypothetical protein BGW80DRAFT_1373783 [Lactifluus volemus]|nr:hypothetical protein BGW80DRAFT_1373783 [Lactifluus volemus]